MGILYSHIVFQPPSPPTYSDDGGVMTFRKVRHDNYDSDDDAPPATATDKSNAGSIADDNLIQHPIFYIPTSKGNTIPAAYFHQYDSYYTILFSHGNGEDLGVTASYAYELSNSLKTSVLCYDYSGYGLATGRYSEDNCYADIRAAYTYLVSEHRIPSTRIVLFGRSLGSGPTVDLAMSLGPNLGGVVLIAALTSCVRVVFNGAQHTKFDMFPNIDKIDKLVVPVFCVHGMADHVVPFNHGVELSHRARFPLEPLWIKGAGHNNLESTRFQFQVFLRYMHVLQELRRWMPPNDLEYNRVAPTSRRRDSFGALVKVASCFGPRGPSGKKTPSPQKTRKRVHRMVGTSSAQLLVPSLTKKDEVDLSVLWSADDDALVRRSMEMERRADRKSLPIARKGSFATRATSVVS